MPSPAKYHTSPALKHNVYHLEDKKATHSFRHVFSRAMSVIRKNIEPNSNDSRSRQSKKDDAIRRKIENELSKKRSLSSRVARKGKAVPGTVSYLKPSEPIICRPSATVYQAAQLMSAKRENCILVVNDKSELIGIFTAKDVAFRIVGSGLNPNSVTIDQIMTPSPLCANANNPASEALTMMVEKGFRHLPVLNDKGKIVGVLDITKSYAQQMEKLERVNNSSKKLYEALDSMNSEIGLSQQPRHVLEYFAELKSKMNGPTLESVLDSTTSPIYANIKTTVYEATLLMKENKTTAVLVKDSNDEVTGIFTSKDTVLRVIATGLDPKKCSLVRVMTPQPDVSSTSTSIQSALRQMFNGHFLNLPVVDDHNDIVGMVDVLKLTYATLHQIKKIESSSAENKDSDEGPAWNKFWTSLDNEDAVSLHSDSLHSDSSKVPDATPAMINSFNRELDPSDSISAVEEESLISKQPTMSNYSGATEGGFVFKFKSPAIEGRVHRVSLNEGENLDDLRSLIDQKLHQKDVEALRAMGNESEKYVLSYIDDEGDVVSITTDSDLRDCIKVNQDLGNKKADIYIHGSHEAASFDRESIYSRRSTKTQGSELVPGVPNTMLVSGALGVASLIAAIFVVTRKH